MNNVNPFRDNRTEYMQELWKQYVPFEQLNDITKPLVIVGGRGSGKTMYFKCSSWNEQLKKYIAGKEDESPENFFEQNKEIGVYYRVDSSFVYNFDGYFLEDWMGYFNSYFSIMILQDLLKLFKKISVDSNQELLLIFVKCLSLLTNVEFVEKDYDSCLEICEKLLDNIQEIFNDPLLESNERIIFKTTPGVVIKKFIDSVGSLEKYKSIRLRIFIDEYENFSEEQQKITNTLVKHSEVNLVYNIAMRPEGMKTTATLGNSECLEEVHDYKKFRLDDEEYIQNYPELIKNIIKSRFIYLKDIGKIPNHVPDDIEYYLDKYSLEKEIEYLSIHNKLPFEHELESIVLKDVSSDNREIYLEKLVYEPAVLNKRIHLALLKRKSNYRVSVSDLYEEYCKSLLGDSTIYSDWYHNTKNAALFLLIGETTKRKMYFGFDTYLKLSSGVIRYFLELCEQALDLELIDGFTWEEPRQIEFNNQTKAAKYVSKSKIADLDYYDPYGKNFKIFIKYIGDIFKSKHYDKDSTLGEPEINHFSTQDLNLNDQLKKILNNAIMWNVIQVTESTKEKESDTPRESKDYLINRIYVPYFDISYRKIRKLMITPDNLDGLLSGDDELARSVAKKIINPSKKESDPNQYRLFV